MKNLEITQEKVIEAANKCPQAKDVLKTLFPEAFGSIKNKCINLQALSLKGGSHPQVFSSAGLQGIGAPLNSFMEIRSTGEYAYEAFYLSTVYYDWAMVTDSEGATCLIPTKKDFK